MRSRIYIFILKGLKPKYCRPNLILHDIHTYWREIISMWCECELSGLLKWSKRANIIRMVSYALQNILYYFTFCFILSLFFLNVYTFIYLIPFSLYFIVCVIFIHFIPFNSISCMFTSSFTFLTSTLSFFSRFFQAFSQSNVRNRLPTSWCISFCLSARISSSPTGGFFVKFNIGDFW
jgi:hypothetical protein